MTLNEGRSGVQPCVSRHASVFYSKLPLGAHRSRNRVQRHPKASVLGHGQSISWMRKLCIPGQALYDWTENYPSLILLMEGCSKMSYDLTAFSLVRGTMPEGQEVSLLPWLTVIFYYYKAQKVCYSLCKCFFN